MKSNCIRKYNKTKMAAFDQKPSITMIVGPRCTGKSTLAMQIVNGVEPQFNTRRPTSWGCILVTPDQEELDCWARKRMNGRELVGPQFMHWILTKSLSKNICRASERNNFILVLDEVIDFDSMEQDTQNVLYILQNFREPIIYVGCALEHCEEKFQQPTDFLLRERKELLRHVVNKLIVTDVMDNQKETTWDCLSLIAG